MLAPGLLKRFDGRRLRLLLAAFFLLLAIPAAVLIRQAYSQLERETWYQHRLAAEELTRSIDARLRERMAEAEARSFADWSFLVLAGDPSANFVQRSQLAAYPVESALPGTLGYFQVDAHGDFTTPLLPAAGTEPASVGIDAEDYARRSRLAARLHEILSDNRLVRRAPAPAPAESHDPAASPAPASAERTAPTDADALAPAERAGRIDSGAPSRAESAGEIDSGARASAEVAEQAVSSAPSLSVSRSRAEPAYAQRRFDELAAAPADSGAGAARTPAAPPDAQVEEREAAAKLTRAAGPESEAAGEALRQVRTKRVEQTALPEAPAGRAGGSFAPPAGREALRVSTFESELDPFELGMLDSGHLVLFRNAWREGQRYVQGILVDREAFIASAILERYRAAALAGSSDLAVTWHDEVIAYRRAAGGDNADKAEGRLLYRGRLSAPLGNLGLVFSARDLPPGPGARVLGWVSVLVAVTLVGGFFGLYRLAIGQLRLARQQQDFVSAVSHELKTPLTSIRMYGELLREGWATEEKRKQYYEYIHDESERLTRLISNVLQLASITRSEPRLAMHPVTVSGLLERIEPKLATQARRAGFELVRERDARAEAAVIQVDEDCFLQVLINLVDNAIKFSAGAAAKKIVLGSRLAGGRVVFSVRDFGPGVPAGQMRRIFELFYRPEGELTRETVGTGIGLAIVHQLCVAMNGSADVVNRDPGAEFRIAFPPATETGE